MREVFYIRRHFFETNSRFEDRVNSVLRDIAKNNIIRSVEWNKTTLIIFYETEIKKPAIKGFSNNF